MQRGYGGENGGAIVTPCVPPVSPVNKRLDEWVTHDRLDLKRVQVPRKEAKTPTKNGLPGSRPGSPERDPVRGQLGTWETAWGHGGGRGGGSWGEVGWVWGGVGGQGVALWGWDRGQIWGDTRDSMGTGTAGRAVGTAL